MYNVNDIVNNLIENSPNEINNNHIELLYRAVNTLLNNICCGKDCYWGDKRIIVPSPHKYIGGWNWDSAFHALATSKWDINLAFEQVDFFFDEMEESGKLIDAIRSNGNKFTFISKPPVWGWVLKEIYLHNKNFDLDKYYNKLVKSVDFWENYRKTGELFHYDCELDHSDDRYAVFSKFESGWDSSVRWDNGAHTVWAIDLNCYMLLTYNSLSFFAKELGYINESKRWENKEQALKNAINTIMWNDSLGCYFDVYIKSGKTTDVYSPASFMPLFTQIASKERAEKLARLAGDENKFYPLFPTVSYDNKFYERDNYWRGPCWLNVTYFALKGLKYYGYILLSDQIKDAVLNACFNEKRGIYEYYDSKTGEGLGAKDFGWSSAFIIEMITNL